MNIKNFKCNENLSQYVDSMLFDSGECIAEMEYEIDDTLITICLEVRGEVKVDFNGVSYNRPSEFPLELKELIKGNPANWDCEDYVYVDMNNWFEYIYTVDSAHGDSYSDGVMCEWDISKWGPKKIKDEMIEICKWIAEDL